MGFLDIARSAQPVVSARRFALNVVIACAGAAVALAGLRALGPIPTQITLDAQRVLAEREQCEVMFAGPSYVVSQIDPREFDRAALRLGRKVHSCIFGGTGFRGVELRVHLERLLDKGWPRLSLIVIDVTLGDEPRFDKVNWFHPRFIQWHTWDAMPWIFEYYRREAFNITAEQAVGHFKHFGANYLNLGAGLHVASVLGIWSRIQRFGGQAVDLPVSDAELDYAHDLAAFESRKKRQARGYMKKNPPERHDKRVAKLVEDVRVAAGQERVRGGVWIAELRRMVRARGYEAFFLGAPVWRAGGKRVVDVPGEDRIVLLEFADPLKYPDLYLPKNRGRTNHVSWYGRVAYSRLLAREILPRWKPTP